MTLDYLWSCSMGLVPFLFTTDPLACWVSTVENKKTLLAAVKGAAYEPSRVGGTKWC